MLENMVVLREITLDDTERIIRWRNKDNVRKNLFTNTKISVSDHIYWYENFVVSGKCVQFIIEDSTSSEPIGTVFIKNIDLRENTGEFGIFIGEDDYRGKGYGLSATYKVLQHAFSTLNLSSVFLNVYSDNLKAIDSYRAVGFKIVNKYKRIIDDKAKNQYKEVVMMSILKKDWGKNT